MNVSFGGIGEMAVTYLADDTVAAGYPVKMSGNGTVTVCGTGERFCGIAVGKSDDGYATVQMKGFITMPYSGTNRPTPGYKNLVANGSGGVKVDAAATPTGGEFLIVEFDETALTVGFYM